MTKKKKYLFTNWELGLSAFQIYDGSDMKNIITQRTIVQDRQINWFNLDNIRREIELYEKNNNIVIEDKYLKETLRDIKEKGFSYTDNTKEKFTLEAKIRNEIKNEKRDLITMFSKEIKIIE